MASDKDLKAWEKSFLLVKEIYQLTKQFPKEEVFGLNSQIKRCAVSVPSNIADGWGRGSGKSFINFLRIAKGSLYELETQLLIVKELEIALIKNDCFDTI